eukprot:5095870-Pleurochrysis_carterae.AAC.1
MAFTLRHQCCLDCTPTRLPPLLQWQQNFPTDTHVSLGFSSPIAERELSYKAVAKMQIKAR